MRHSLKAILLASLVFAAPLGALASETTGGATGGATGGSSAKNDGNTCNYRDRLKQMESGGKYDIGNNSGYDFRGAYQFGRKALIDTKYMDQSGKWLGRDGIWTETQFRQNPWVQEKAQAEFEQKQDKYAKDEGLEKYIGQQAPGCSAGTKITQEGIRGMVHLVGAGGASSYLSSGGVCGRAKDTGLKHNTVDGTKGANPTCARKYLCALSSCQSIEKDMNKKTCDVTMPMIEAISCSNYSGELKSLCEYAQPALMTRAECNAAETWAEAAPKGPQKESCEGQTFGPGTGSWSYVLACSYASEGVADNDGVENPKQLGPTNDPQCMQSLRGMGVEFKELGQVSNGSYGGTTCIIENAVSLRGTAIPYGANLTMTCDTAKAMENFGQKMKNLGVTGYYGIGSTRGCGPKRDKRGNLAGTITEHALGRAVDISGFYYRGKKVSFGAIHNPSSYDGMIAIQAKNAACSTFNLVLSPTYAQYSGTFVHFHLEQSRMKGCR